MTPRAISVGLLFSFIIGLVTPYSDLVLKGTWIGLTSFPISAFALLVVLVGVVNVLLRLRARGLSPGEILVIYCCALVSAGLPSFGWTGLLIPYLAGPLYFATPENKFEQYLLPNLPSWFHPTSAYAIEKLYEGLRPGERVPWQEWIVPLSAMTVLATGLFACMFGLCAMLRRRWVEEEKLVFPLVELPSELVNYGQRTVLWPSLLTNKVMWGFFAVPFFIHTVNGLHFYWPAIPEIPVYRISLDMHVASKPWSALSPLWLRILFSIIALAYLLPGELSLSLWLFYFFFLAQQVIGEAAGLPMPNVQAYPVRRFVAEQMIGGIITFGVLGLLGTGHVWREMWQSMWFTTFSPTHNDEALRPGVAGWLILGGLATVGLWGSYAGAGLSNTVLLMVLFLLLHLVAVRLVCEAGMLSIQHPYRPLNIFLAAGGTGAFRPRQIAVLAFLDHLLMLDNRSPLMPAIMQSLKVADRGNLRRSHLMACLAAAVAITIITSYVSYLRLMYRYGGASLHPWFTMYYAKNLYANWTTHLIRDGEAARPAAFGLMAVGSLTMLLLMNLHHRFTWWPLSPIGYLMGASWPMINFWFPIFVGWLIKTAVLHYGGPKAYRFLLPGFLGWILAEFLSAGLWVAIDMLAGVRGHQIFTF